MKLGADYIGKGICNFRLWAPLLSKCTLKLNSGSRIELLKDQTGYFKTTLDEISPGVKYYYEVEGKNYPDPASNYQPDGVHGPSEIIDQNDYKWRYDIDPPELKDLIIYELHIGTFSPEGTFRAAAEKLKYLKELGVTAVEIMPVSQYPGDRNWGYDGVNFFAPQNSYGRPEDMKFFIDECHRYNLYVILDVVYNHFGPEGNYLRIFGPYFTNHYTTPWGEAINFDDEYSDDVRTYFFENAIFWLTTYNIDGLRLDAIDHIYDMGAKHFLAELTEKVETIDVNEKKKFIIAESDLNDPKIIRPKSQYGYGCDMQWNDDFHHSIHSLLTGESNGYYMDFGKISHLVTAYNHTFVYSGKYSPHRKRRHGSSAAGRPKHQFVVCTQNHDQVGNRVLGRRLTNLVSFEALKLAAGATILSPYIPLLFMGEEYGEENPFLYFISHYDPVLVEAVREGRKNEFSSFKWEIETPDPFSEDTFNKSKLKWELLGEGKNKTLFQFYKQLINCRKNNSVLKAVESNNIDCTGDEESKTITLHLWNGQDSLFIIMNFNIEPVTKLINIPDGRWRKFIDSASEQWLGPGSSTPVELLGEPQNITVKGLSITGYETELKNE